MKIKMTALAARFAECLLACHITPIESIFRGAIRGPLAFLTTPGPKQFCGNTAIGSGTGFVTVSTALVTSGMNINVNFLATAAVASGQAISGPPTVVSSIVDGVSMAIGYLDGAGRAPGGVLMWELRRTR